MPADSSAKPAPRLTFESQLHSLAQLWPWVQALAAEYSIPPNMQFAINLCLEEAISNVIRHGYHSQPGHSVTVDSKLAGARDLIFIIEDRCPPFDPLDRSVVLDAPTPLSIDRFPPGGQGIRFLRKFAGSLAYQRLADGNRLTIGFTLPR